MGIGISPTWTFKEIVNNIKTIKLRYEEILSSFSNWETKEKTDFKKEVRDSIYSLNIERFQKERIWEYMNDCLDFIVLKQLCERKNNGKRIKR